MAAQQPQPKPPAVTVKVGKATVTIPLELVTAALANPQGRRLLAQITRR